jgi:hypothetical protein
MSRGTETGKIHAVDFFAPLFRKIPTPQSRQARSSSFHAVDFSIGDEWTFSAMEWPLP